MGEQGYNSQLYNLSEVVRNLEYLLEVAQTPADKARYRERLEQSRKQLESMMGSTGEGASGS